MKYVRIDATIDGKQTRKLVIAFPNDLTHADVADALQDVCVKTWEKQKVRTKVVSAGEISMTVEETNGRSVSLGNLESREEDARLPFLSDYSGHVEWL